MEIRFGRPDDEPALRALDRATWHPTNTPGPMPGPDDPFFNERSGPQDHLVAVDGGAIVGYLRLGPVTPFASSAHVLMVRGLAVAPAARRQGLGRRLLEAGIAEATRRGARRLTLRVFATNPNARALYESCGFEVEGVLRGEFHLDGADVDDIMMARRLTPT